MKCKNCETELEEKQKYCSNCGERVEENSTSEERIEENSTIMDHLIKEANKQPKKKGWIKGVIWVLLLVILSFGFSLWFHIRQTIANDPINGRWWLVESTGELADTFVDLIIINRNTELKIDSNGLSVNFQGELSLPNTKEYNTSINEYENKFQSYSLIVMSDNKLFDLPTSYDYKNKTKAEFEKDFKEMIEEKVLDSRTFTKHEVKRVKKELAPLIELYLQIFEIDRGKTSVAFDAGEVYELSDLERKVTKELGLPDDTLSYKMVLYELDDMIRPRFFRDFILNEDQTLKITNSADDIFLFRKAER